MVLLNLTYKYSLNSFLWPFLLLGCTSTMLYLKLILIFLPLASLPYPSSSLVLGLNLPFANLSLLFAASYLDVHFYKYELKNKISYRSQLSEARLLILIPFSQQSLLSHYQYSLCLFVKYKIWCLTLSSWWQWNFELLIC